MASSEFEMEYVQSLVGTPWDRNGLHCWALVVQTQRDLYGRELPLMRESVPTASKNGRTVTDRGELRELLSRQAERYGWTEVEHPAHGCVVRMHHIGDNPHNLEHVGVYFDWDGGMVMHSDDPHGVVLDDMTTLTTLRGWVPRYFQPINER